MDMRSLHHSDTYAIQEAQALLEDEISITGKREGLDIDIPHWLRNHGAICLVIEVWQKVVAALYAIPVVSESYHGSMHNIAVQIQYRYRGLASRLLDEYMSHARQKKHWAILFTEIHHSNLPAQTFHKKHGFEKIMLTHGISIEAGFEVYINSSWYNK